MELKDLLAILNNMDVSYSIDKREVITYVTVRSLNIENRKNIVLFLNALSEQNEIGYYKVSATLWVRCDFECGEFHKKETEDFLLKAIDADVLKVATNVGGNISCLLKPDAKKMFPQYFNKALKIVDGNDEKYEMKLEKNYLTVRIECN